MEENYKKIAVRQYFKYFRFWFILVGVAGIVCLALYLRKGFSAKGDVAQIVRGNFECGTQRVFDYADVLTDSEEEELTALIAQKENEAHFDIVVVTIREDIEARGNRERVMMQLADDFYDQGNYGFNKVHGDGVLFLDNWYKDENGSQAGTHLSTCGKVYAVFGTDDIDKVLTQVDNYIDKSAYQAYAHAIEKACRIYLAKTSGGGIKDYLRIPLWAILAVPLVIALIYMAVVSGQHRAKDTTTLMQYVKDGSVDYKVKEDKFIRKNTTSVKIETSSSGGSGGHGGGHVSGGGVSHGGGSHRR